MQTLYAILDFRCKIKIKNTCHISTKWVYSNGSRLWARYVLKAPSMSRDIHLNNTSHPHILLETGQMNAAKYTVCFSWFGLVVERQTPFLRSLKLLLSTLVPWWGLCLRPRPLIITILFTLHFHEKLMKYADGETGR